MERIIKDVESLCEQINEDISSNVVCFTGHRSQKLPWGFNEEDIRYKLARIETKKEIIKCIKSGKNHFISGMALGFDMMCAEIVLSLKKTYPNIILECAVPCVGQEKRWPLSQQNRYKRILHQADKIRCIFDYYTQNCMEERNRYMVNSSSLVIALFNGREGGTKNTIDYAKRQGKEIIIITPRTSKTLSEEDIDALIDDHFEGAKKVTAEDKEAYRFYLQKLMLW